MGSELEDKLREHALAVMTAHQHGKWTESVHAACARRATRIGACMPACAPGDADRCATWRASTSPLAGIKGAEEALQRALSELSALRAAEETRAAARQQQLRQAHEQQRRQITAAYEQQVGALAHMAAQQRAVGAGSRRRSCRTGVHAACCAADKP